MFKLRVSKAAAVFMFATYVLYILYQFAAAYGWVGGICFQSVNICI